MVDLEKRRPAMRCELNGVEISSRYDHPAEIAVMMQVLMALRSCSSRSR